MYNQTLTMELEDYNRSFEEVIETADEEAENALRYIRQQCVRDFIERINRRQSEWEAAFLELLNKSQEEEAAPKEASKIVTKKVSFNLSDPTDGQQLSMPPTNFSTPDPPKQETKSKDTPATQEIKVDQNVKAKQDGVPEKPEIKPGTTLKVDGDNLRNNDSTDDYNDPHFSNSPTIKDFIRIQKTLEDARKSCDEISTSPALRSYKNELNLFIRTQINSISNSGSDHLDSKTRLLTSLFSGHRVNFQDRLTDASQHPQGQLFAMYLAAQTFVTVGSRLVNSVPAIAKSMGTVMNGIISRNFLVFKDLVIGNLQERCPYLVPMQPKITDFKGTEKDREVKFKIACGYSYDIKSQSLESEEKYLARMRSMALIYACFLIEGHMSRAWTWLVAYVSLKPQPVITATILQAFLQEASKKMSAIYGRQYQKLIRFIKDDYVKMIEEVTTQGVERQSLIKLKNLMADESKLIATPSVGSIFGAVRFS